MKKIILSLGFIFVSLSAIASAGDLYAYGSLGSGNYSGGKSSIDSALVSAGVTGLSSTMTDSSTAFKAGVGYQFVPNIAAEVSYANLGTLNYTATASGGRYLTADIKTSGTNYAVIASSDISESLSLFAKLGYTSASSDVKMIGSGGVGGFSSDNSGNMYGVGATYKSSQKLGLRAEWEKMYDDYSVISAGVQLGF